MDDVLLNPSQRSYGILYKHQWILAYITVITMQSKKLYSTLSLICTSRIRLDSNLIKDTWINAVSNVPWNTIIWIILYFHFIHSTLFSMSRFLHATVSPIIAWYKSSIMASYFYKYI